MFHIKKPDLSRLTELRRIRLKLLFKERHSECSLKAKFYMLRVNYPKAFENIDLEIADTNLVEDHQQ